MPILNKNIFVMNRQTLQRNAPRGVALMVLLILYVSLASYFVTNSEIFTYESMPSGLPDDTIVGELIDGTVVKQTIHSEINISGVGIKMATYGRVNDGDIRYVVRDLNNNKVLVDQVIPVSQLIDNEYFDLDFEGHLVANNVEISISAFGAISGKGVTIWMSNTDQDGDVLTFNGETLEGELDYSRIVQTPQNVRGLVLHRLMLSGILFAFIGLHFVLGYRKIYDFIFKYRVFVALGITVFCVINGYHFSSIGMFDQYVEPGMGSAYVEPIFGKLRSIRSDEWLVSTPQMLTGQFTDYLGPNSILQAMESPILPTAGVFFGLSGFAIPRTWLMYFLPANFGVSFYFCSGLIMAFFFSFEFFYVITRKSNKAVALIGASFTVLSTYYMWWSFAYGYFAAQAAVVMLYYALHARHPITRTGFGFGTAVFGSFFVCQFYPAWQVPLGYVFLIILIYIIIDAGNVIKSYRKVDFAILFFSIGLMIAFIGSYLYDSREYITAITNTVYPGKRVMSGDPSLYKLFNYVPALFFSFFDVQNPSESAMFINFFPLPVLLNIYYMIRTKKFNLLATLLIIVSIIFSICSIMPLPELFLKVTLLLHSIPKRIVDIVAFIQIILLVIALTHYDQEKKLKILPVLIMTAPIMLITGYYSASNFEDAIGKLYIYAACILLGLLFVVVVSYRRNKVLHMTTASIFVLCAVTSLTVLPFSKSLDAIYSKPISIHIQGIVETDPDAKWLSLNNQIDCGLLVANGAPTINSVQVIPNIELWEKLDPHNQYEEIYNRYAHLTVEISEEDTKPELAFLDHIILKLNPADLKKTGAQYILSPSPISSTDSYNLIQLYGANGHFIYQVQYN